MPPTPQRRRWLLYALGGGLGHVTRAAALARAALRAGRQTGSPLELCLLTNSPWADHLALSRELPGDVHTHRIEPSCDRNAVARQVREVLQDASYDVLVVDTFARGLAGELTDLLPNLAAAKVLVHRDVQPRYVDACGLREFVDHFDLLLLPGEDAPLGGAAHAVRTAPWLIRDAGELPPAAAARQRLLSGGGRLPMVLVLGSGKLSEVLAFEGFAERLAEQLAGRAEVRFATLHNSGGPRTVRIWPLLDCLPGVDVLVGAGGYGAVWESRSVGVPLLAVPRPRLYDRQSHRLRPEERVANLSEAARRITVLLDRLDRPGGRPDPSYFNGVHEAVRLLTELEFKSRAGLSCQLVPTTS